MRQGKGRSAPTTPTRRGRRKNSASTSRSEFGNRSEPQLDVQAILAGDFVVPDTEDPEDYARSRPRDQLSHLTHGESGGKTVYGNEKGQNIYERLDEHDRRLARLESDAKASRKEAADARIEAAEVKRRVLLLSQCSDSYMDIRKRFLDTYQRDIQGKTEIKSPKAIKQGNIKAHEGDVFVDASLFKRDERNDRALFTELYGLSVVQVLDFADRAADDGGLFTLLNAHATMRAKGITPSPELQSAFETFLDKMEDSWPQPPKQVQNSPVYAAYFTYWKLHNLENRSG